MSTEEKKPNIFNQAINALSSRDEKAALEEAQKQLEEMKKQLAQAQQAAAQAQTAAAQAKASSQVAGTQAKSEAQKAVEEANRRAAEAQARAREMEMKIQRMADAQEAEDRRKDVLEAQKAVEAAKIISEHTVADKDTLGALALKYYGHATKPYYMVIYEANKDLIGNDPNRVKLGLKLKIPVLPPELKDK